MRSLRLISLLAIGICCGCGGVCKQLTRTLVSETRYQGGEKRTVQEERRLAECAWQSLRKSNPELCCSQDFAKGFEDGFAGYLHTGCPDPPPIPPETYRQPCPDGINGWRAAQEWFAGYRTGADVAFQSGYRANFVVPVSQACGGCVTEPSSTNGPQELSPMPSPSSFEAALFECPSPSAVMPAAFLPRAKSFSSDSAQVAIYQEAFPRAMIPRAMIPRARIRGVRAVERRAF